MRFRFILTALLSTSLVLPVIAAPVASPAVSGIQAHGALFSVAAKKKKKQKPVRHNPRNGDILVGPVKGFNKPDWRNARRARAVTTSAGS